MYAQVKPKSLPKYEGTGFSFWEMQVLSDTDDFKYDHILRPTAETDEDGVIRCDMWIAQGPVTENGPARTHAQFAVRERDLISLTRRRLLAALDAAYANTALASAMATARTENRQMTPREIWTSITARSRNVSHVHVQALIDQYRSTRQAQGSDVREYITTLELAKCELAACGNVYTDADFKYTILKGLDDSYRGIEDILRNDESKTAAQCIDALRAQHTQRSVRDGISVMQGNAHQSQDSVFWTGLPNTSDNRGTQRDRDYKGEPRSERRCYECHKKGHIKKHCTASSDEEDKPRIADTKHKKNRNQSNHTKAVDFALHLYDSDGSDDEDAECHASQHTGGVIRNAWLIDCGSNVHICNDRASFIHIDSAGGKGVNFGQGTLQKSSGRGRVQLNLLNKSASISDCLFMPKMRVNILSMQKMTKNRWTFIGGFNSMTLTAPGARAGDYWKT